MTDRFRHRLGLLCAVLLLAYGSVASAAMMAPDRADAAEAQLAVLGLSADDLCGTPAGHDHRCPFCHLVADTPVPVAGGAVARLLPVAAWQRARDLHRAAQARDHARSPRAPPSIA